MLAAACAALLGAAACSLDAQVVGATGSFERSLRVDGPVDLAVKTGSGRIQIQTGTPDNVRIVGRIRARGAWWSGIGAAAQVKRLEADPPVVQSGNTIQIGEIADFALRQNVSISYELTVPAATRIRSRSGSGDQAIGAVAGPLDAETGSGNIRTARIGAHVTVSTGSGDIDVLGADGGLDARAGSGDIHAQTVAGRMKVRTGSGDVELAQTSPGDLEVSTGSGGITVTGAQGGMRLRAGSGDIIVEGRPLGDWMLNTGSGNITIRVPATAAFNLDARTASGSIDTSRPIEVIGTLSTRRLQAKAGGGGARLDVSTGSGTIRID